MRAAVAGTLGGLVSVITQYEDEERDKDAAAADAAAGGDEEAGGREGKAQNIPPVQGPKGLVGVVLVVLQPAPFLVHRRSGRLASLLVGGPTAQPANEPRNRASSQCHKVGARE